MRHLLRRVAKTHGISNQTIYLWHKHFGKLQPADVKRLRHLEQKNARLEEADCRARSRDRGDEEGRGKEIVGAPVRHEQASFVQQHGASLRKACALLSVSRSALRYGVAAGDKPWQNESFNGKFRDECLSMQWFKNRTEAKT